MVVYTDIKLLVITGVALLIPTSKVTLYCCLYSTIVTSLVSINKVTSIMTHFLTLYCCPYSTIVSSLVSINKVTSIITLWYDIILI